ncbi:MAG: hypothetical protein ACPG4T_14225, partial [Nannocystaceae bacterium]
LGTLELRNLLEAALGEAEAGGPEQVFAHVRTRLATAVNAGLAGAPRALEVCTAGSGVRFERRETTPSGQDPYRECGTSQRCAAQHFCIRLWAPKPSFGRRLASWISLQPSVVDNLEQLWKQAVVGIEPEQTLEAGLSLATTTTTRPIELGDHATWDRGGEARADSSLWLVRDRVRIASLSPAIAAIGQSPTLFVGEVCCPHIRLTADRTDVVRDGAFELLVAWLLDAHAHLFEQSGDVHWPTSLQSIPAASGRAVPVETLQRRMKRGQDLLFVYPYQQPSVPKELRARVFCLWPSERALLHRTLPGLQTVPLRALGGKPQFERHDLGNLASGSLPPQTLALGPDHTHTTLPSGQRVAIECCAYIHRYPTSVAGSLVLVTHGRRLGHLRDDPRVLDGVTLVATLKGDSASETDLDIHDLRQQQAFLQGLFNQLSAAALAETEIEKLLVAAFTTASPRAIPLVHTREAALGPWDLRLRFVRPEGSEQLKLHWRPTCLLGLEVGSARFGGRGVSFVGQTLADALTYASEHGGLWSSDTSHTRSASHKFAPWHLHTRGRDLLVRVLGSGGIWPGSADPNEYLRPRPASEQTHLLRAAGTCASLAKRTHEPWARRALLAHLLVATALGVPTHGLEDIDLLLRYDPQALQPTRRVSLATLREHALPPLVPEGAVSRELDQPVLEVNLGEANILHTHLHFPLVGDTVFQAKSTSGKRHRDPVRRRGREPAPLVHMPLHDPLAAGGLRVDVDLKPGAITLWSGGLHIDNLKLAPPLDCVGGRLWLTRKGLRSLSTLADRVRDLARGVVSIALDSQLLHEPGSVEHRAIVTFLGQCYAAAQRGEATLIADLLPERTPTPPRTSFLAHTLNKFPLKRLPKDPRPRLLGLLRQTLMLPIRLETAVFSWSLVRSMEGPDHDGLWTVELGRRNGFITRALDPESDPQAVFVTCSMILAAIVP